MDKLGTRHAFPFYKRKIRDLLGKYGIEKESASMIEYTNIIDGMFKAIMDEVFDGNDVILGSNLGIVGIRGKKTKGELTINNNIKGLAPAWGQTKAQRIIEAEKRGQTYREYMDSTTKEERPIVFCFNEHSNGIRYCIMWIKKDCRVKNRTLYSLKFNRANKRRLMTLVNNGREYLEVSV